MARPLETLGKMLDLETRDYGYQDRAVAGGLAGYAGTWRRQALEKLGEDARSWIESVIDLMKAYSASAVVSRQEVIGTLREMLRVGPGETLPHPQRSPWLLLSQRRRRQPLRPRPPRPQRLLPRCP